MTSGQQLAQDPNTNSLITADWYNRTGTHPNLFRFLIKNSKLFQFPNRSRLDPNMSPFS